MKRIAHIYIHIPFCVKKCNYCSFFSNPEKPYSAYFDAIKREIEFYQKKYDILAKTIYFGGGTPSLVNPTELQKILNLFDIEENCEITLEANPITVSEKYAEKISQTKINRISLGVQSFLEKELEILGRLHKPKDVDNSIKYLRNNGFKNISLDLMYGLPFQTKSQLLYSLEKIVAKNPEHISTYCLSLEKNVPMFSMKKNIPDDEIVAEFYQSIFEVLKKSGFERYEISNFSKKGLESKHNLSYWELDDYLGIGAGASGFINNLRYTNFADTKKYIDAMNKSEKSYSEHKLSTNDKKSEFVFLGLRKSAGISIKRYNEKFKSDVFEDFGNIIQKYVESGYLILSEKSLRLAEKSYFISNEIFSDFIL